MSFPASVEQVTSSRLRRKPTRQRSRLLPWEDQLPEAGEEDARTGVGGPVLDIGRVGGATLDKVKGRWGWKWLKQEGRGPSLTVDEGVLLYPACRTPDVDLASVPSSKVADSAVDYVRALPDVSEYASISDLIVEELAETNKLPKLDVYKGETLAVVTQSRVKHARILLAFPAGPIGNMLNISPFLPRSDGKRHRPYLTTFRPHPKPAERFPTEILQICSSPYHSGNKIDREATALLVRLHISTHLINVSAQRVTCSDPASMVETTRVGELEYTATENRRHVDAVLDEATWSKALIVDEGGGVWLWWEEKVEVRERLAKTMRLRKIRNAVSDTRHGFFKVAFGSRPGTALVMSTTQLTVIDFEGGDDAETIILEISGEGRRFTGLEKTALTRQASFTCVVTTHEVVWVDELKLGAPVLTWRHDFGGGLLQDLQLIVVQTNNIEYTLLSSASSPLIMTFQVPSSAPVRSDISPQCLSLPFGSTDSTSACLTSLTLDLTNGKSVGDTHLAVIGSDGAVTTFEFRPPADQSDEMDLDNVQVMRRQHPEPLWDQYKDIASVAPESTTKESPEKAKTKHKVLSLREIWLELNSDPDIRVPFTLQAMEQHLRELDAPLDSFVTLGDLARDAIHEGDSGRAHALLPLQAGPDTITQDLVAVGGIDLARHDLTAVTRLPDTLASVDTSAKELLTTFSGNDQIPGSGREGMKHDTLRLVLELTLSRMIVHSDSVAPASAATPRSSQEPQTADNLFERAEQLTLNDGGSKTNEIPFHWLSPRNTFEGEEQAHDNPDARLQTDTARTLLSEWTVGTDPAEYKWTDWRREGSAPPTPIRRPVRPLPSPRTTGGFAQSQPDLRYRPPTLAQPQPRQWPPLTQPFNSVPQIMAHTQTMRSSPPPVQSSQPAHDPGPSTQVERGPFGGRLEGKARKKAAKRRVGGF